jgi:hypothetical protein
VLQLSPSLGRLRHSAESSEAVEPLLSRDFTELNSDQRREVVNTQQRFLAWREAFARREGCKGSILWSTSKGREYLMRVAYDKQGHRRQKSLGPRGADTEMIKADFEKARDEAERRLETI